MLYFLDTADVEAIEETMKYYPIDGVTTNPLILQRDIKDGMSLVDFLKDLRKLTKDKLLFVQATSRDAKGIVRDAEKIVSALGGKISIKVPTNKEGFEAIKYLKKEGISTTSTACYTTSQALLAAKSGADFVAPYVSHIDNLSLDGAQIAGEMSRQLLLHGFETKVLAAAFRTASQVERCLAFGVGSITMTPQMFDILSHHTGTDSEIKMFEEKWSSKFSASIGEIIEKGE